MNAWNIFVLGPFVVKKGGEPLSDKLWRSRQTRTILKILLTRRGHVVSAEQLIDILWPDASPKSARRNLYVRISQLRRVLADTGDLPLIQTVEGGYVFQQTAVCKLDVAEFEDHAAQGRRHLQTGNLAEALIHFQQASDLYQGDFLVEDLYEAWSFSERERLRELYLTMLTEMAECLAQQGEYRQAIQTCQDVLTVDPVREVLYVRLMLYHYYAGEKAQALRIFARCQYVLAKELGVEPLPETAVLAEKIREDTVPVNGSVTYPSPVYNGRLFDVPYSLGNPPLVGREREYAWLVDRWQDPQTTLLFVNGAAGVGKSYLINHFCGYLRTQAINYLLLVGQVGKSFPYRTLTTFIANHPDWLLGLEQETRAALLPLFPKKAEPQEPLLSLPSLTIEQETIRLHKALLALLQTKLPSNTVIVVDDAQWLDSDSLAVLLAWGKDKNAVFIYRTEDVTQDHSLWQTIEPYQRCGCTAQLTLTPLPDKAIADLVSCLAGQPLPDIASQLITQSQGNPLFVISILQHLFDKGDLLIDKEGVWHPTGTNTTKFTPPPSLKEIISQRLLMLEPVLQKVIDTVAVIGGAVDYALLAHIMQLNSDALFALVDNLMMIGLLVEPRQDGQAELALAHGYYCDVAYEMLPAYRRRHLHGQVAEALVSFNKSHDAIAPIVAHHFLYADQHHRAAHWFDRAGDVALERFALATAKTYYQQALRLGPEAPASIWQKVGQIAHQQACYNESAAAHKQALDLYIDNQEKVSALQSRLYLAESLREASRFEEALTHAERALREKTVLQEEPALHAKAHITLSNVYRSSQLASVDIIHHHLEAGLVLAKEAKAHQLIGETNFWLGVLAINRGDAVTAYRYDEAAFEQFERLNLTGWLTITYNNLAYHALLAGNPRKALSWAEQGLILAEKVEARHATGWLLSTLGEIQTHLGRLPEAEQTLRRGLKLVETYGPPRLKPGFLVDIAIVKIAETAWREANSTLHEAAVLAQETAPQFVPRVQVLLAETHLGIGNFETAKHLATEALQAAQFKKQQRVVGQAWRLQAKIQASHGNKAKANDCFSRSYELLSHNGDKLEQAKTTAVWGNWLISQGDTARGLALHAKAREAFEACEAILELRSL